MTNIQHFNHPGHYHRAYDCLFFLHTRVNGYCISTVGNLQPGIAKSEGKQQLGRPEAMGGFLSMIPTYTYETMVFELDASGEKIRSFSEVASATARTAQEAEWNHGRMTGFYAAKERPQWAELSERDKHILRLVRENEWGSSPEHADIDPQDIPLYRAIQDYMRTL